MLFLRQRYDNYSRPSNPFLVPLTKYLDRYATETMDYFLDRERLGRASTAGLLVRGNRINALLDHFPRRSGVMVRVKLRVFIHVYLVYIYNATIVQYCRSLAKVYPL